MDITAGYSTDSYGVNLMWEQVTEAGEAADPDLADSCPMLRSVRPTVYLQHALLLLLPPFLTLSLLIGVPRPAVTPPGLGQQWN